MSMKPLRNTLAASAVATALLATLAPVTAQATYYGHGGDRPVTVYFTRHAEKKTTTVEVVENGTPSSATTTYELVWDDANDTFTTSSPGIDDDLEPNDPSKSKGANLDEVCGISKCAEELSDLGLKRAELLAKWFKRRGITRHVDAVYSSHKRRTLQTVEPIADDAGVSVVQLPMDGEELQPESTSPSECPTIDAILGANAGDTLVVAGHSGTLYDIMGDGNSSCAGLGLRNRDGSPLTDDSPSTRRFPKDEDDKVRDFGDIWKVLVYPNGDARFVYRVNLQPKALFVDNVAR